MALLPFLDLRLDYTISICIAKKVFLPRIFTTNRRNFYCSTLPSSLRILVHPLS